MKTNIVSKTRINDAAQTVSEIMQENPALMYEFIYKAFSNMAKAKMRRESDNRRFIAQKLSRGLLDFDAAKIKTKGN